MSGVPHSTEPVPGASVSVFRSASPERDLLLLRCIVRSMVIQSPLDAGEVQTSAFQVAFAHLLGGLTYDRRATRARSLPGCAHCAYLYLR